MAEFVKDGDTHGSTQRRWPERFLFVALTAACLLPVWLFRFLPTQDGPAHLANAVILRDYGTPGSRRHEFFQLAWEPFPNWTGHWLLARLSPLVHPLIAEKLLVTGYIVGFACACRFFLASWSAAAEPFAPLCLLFVYNRCFFMGFYNYCLSLPLLFAILGVCVRLPQRLSPSPLLLLAGLFLLAYFTHLVGYVQAAFGAVLLVMVLPGRPCNRLLCVAAALSPSLAFCANYLLSTGLTPGVVADAVRRNLGGNRSGAAFSTMWEDATHLNRDLFIASEGWSLPVGLGFLMLYVAFVAAGLYDWFRLPAGASYRGWLSVLILGLVMGVLYVVAPDWIGKHGGVLKPRLAVVLPVFALALLRTPTIRWLRYSLLGGSCALVAAGVICTWSHVAAANRLLERYIDGVNEMGSRHVVYVIQSTNQRPYAVSYLLHASHYYALDTGCTNLDNYEAAGHYFPVRFRPGVCRGRGSRQDFAYYLRKAAVDRIIAWEWPARPNAPPPDGFRAIYRRGPLTIYAR